MSASQSWFQSFVIRGRYAEQLAQIPSERSEAEACFIVRALALPRGAHILDLACGVGRHAVILGQRGYRVTGIDLDSAALAIAAARAKKLGVTLELHQADMRDIPFEGQLDAVISIFSSFGYYDGDQEDMQVLAAVARALMPGGRLLIDLVNRESVFRDYSERDWRTGPDGEVIITKYELDLRTSRHTVTESFLHPGGQRSERWHGFRFYTLTELIRNLNEVGFVVVQTWGDFKGSPYTLESGRMIVLAEKPRTRTNSAPERE